MELLNEIKNQNRELLELVEELQAKSDSLINELDKSAENQDELKAMITALQGELGAISYQMAALLQSTQSDTLGNRQ